MRAFEAALQQFIDAALDHEPFIKDLAAFVARIDDAGRLNSLAQTLMKHTVPGVPDLYQGSELWDFSLVDPDNRRPVDYTLRRNLLQQIRDLGPGAAAAEAMRRADEGLPKMWTIHRALRLRRQRPQSFGASASYVPLSAAGSKAGHVIAYLRGDDVVTVVPRHPYLLRNDWEDTASTLRQGDWTNSSHRANVSAGGRVPVQTLLSVFPVALLVKDNA